MKCQNCGKNEVNFHYSSNVNGAVTETHLCSECAEQSGYDIESMFDFENIFADMLQMRSPFGRLGGLGGIGGFMPLAIPVMNTGAVMPIRVRPRISTAQHDVSQGCGCPAGTKNVEVDEKMSKLRELNVQMRAAVEKEDFERAAELRDQIKELKTPCEGESK